MRAIPRQLRRRLERRADTLFARTLPALRGLPLFADVADTFVIVREPRAVHLMDRLDAVIALRALDAPDLIVEIDHARETRASNAIPVIAVLDCGWATVTWTDAMMLSKGGAA